MVYDLTPLKAPRSNGALLRVLVGTAENPLSGLAVARKFLNDIGVEAMRQTPAHLPPTFHPPLQRGPIRESGGSQTADVPDGPAESSEAFPFETAADFTSAYQSGGIDPEEVVWRFFEWLDETEQGSRPLRTFIAQHREDLLAQARAASKRYADGQALGPLDGVPVAVKDELDQAGYATTVGTAFLGRRVRTEDAEVVARLRRAGALLLGKANMHELGLGVTGLNPITGAARNPYDPTRVTGGSSSGSAAAVAAGFCPIAVGADGGGSIRVPAALCGVIGLKATFGRMSEHGAAPLCWSLAHVGPLAASVRDLTLAYSVMAGADPKDPMSLGQPQPTLEDIDRTDLEGLRLAVFPEWLDDAEPAVVGACRRLIEGFEEAGAELVQVAIPELALLRTLHLVTITSEILTAHLDYYRRHRSRYGLDTRMTLAVCRHLTSRDYVHAQRLRTRVCAHFDKALEGIDALLVPTTTRTAPEINPAALETGESDVATTDALMRNTLPANVTGRPAISMPAGYDPNGLPVGLQALGSAWNEPVLLRLARVAEGLVVRETPRVHRRLLN